MWTDLGIGKTVLETGDNKAKPIKLSSLTFYVPEWQTYVIEQYQGCRLFFSLWWGLLVENGDQGLVMGHHLGQQHLFQANVDGQYCLSQLVAVRNISLFGVTSCRKSLTQIKNEGGFSTGAKDYWLLHPKIFLRKVFLDVYQRHFNFLGFTAPEGDLNPNPHLYNTKSKNEPLWYKNISRTEQAKFEDRYRKWKSHQAKDKMKN